MTITNETRITYQSNQLQPTKGDPGQANLGWWPRGSYPGGKRERTDEDRAFLSAVHAVQVPGIVPRAVFRALGYFASLGNARRAFPRVGQLATYVGGTERGVIKVLRRLEAAGWIVQTKKGGGRRLAAEYRLNVKTLNNVHGLCRETLNNVHTEEGRSDNKYKNLPAPLRDVVASIGAAVRTGKPTKNSGSIDHRFSPSKQGRLFMGVTRKLARVRGEKIDDDELVRQTKKLQSLDYTRIKAVLDPLLHEERMLAAKGEVKRAPAAVGGPGAVRQRPSPNGDVVQVVGSVAKSMPVPSSVFGETAPKNPWKYEARYQRPRRTTPDCAEHVFSEPAGDGIETCFLCLRERGTIHPVKED